MIVQRQRDKRNYLSTNTNFGKKLNSEDLTVFMYWSYCNIQAIFVPRESYFVFHRQIEDFSSYLTENIEREKSFNIPFVIHYPSQCTKLYKITFCGTLGSVLNSQHGALWSSFFHSSFIISSHCVGLLVLYFKDSHLYIYIHPLGFVCIFKLLRTVIHTHKKRLWK